MNDNDQDINEISPMNAVPGWQRRATAAQVFAALTIAIVTLLTLFADAQGRVTHVEDTVVDLQGRVHSISAHSQSELQMLGKIQSDVEGVKVKLDDVSQRIDRMQARGR